MTEPGLKRQEGPTEKSSSRCAYFWNHICVRENGRPTPCCRFSSKQIEGEIERLNLNAETALSSQIWSRLRQLSKGNQKIDGCLACYQEEEAGLYSLRQKANADFSIDLALLNSHEPQLQYLEIFLSDVCNLRCIGCGPLLSTTWRNHLVRLNHNLPPRAQPASTEIFSRAASQVEKIKFVGGEPLLAPNHLDFLKSIHRDRRKKITLNYYTNLTIFPPDPLLEIWKDFNKIELSWSIDGIAEVNERIRPPSSWSCIEENAKKFLDLNKRIKLFKFNVHCTVMIDNLLDLKNLSRWFSDLQSQYPSSDLAFLHFNPLKFPRNLAIDSAPSSMIAEFEEICEVEQNPALFDILNYAKTHGSKKS